MSEQDRLRHIAKIAADAAGKASQLSKDLAEHSMFTVALQDLIYQLGYIEGLSYVPEEDDDTR